MPSFVQTMMSSYSGHSVGTETIVTDLVPMAEPSAPLAAQFNVNGPPALRNTGSADTVWGSATDPPMPPVQDIACTSEDEVVVAADAEP